MCVHINDLSYDLLSYLFDFLPDKEIFKIEIICKKWQICMKKLLNRKESFNWKNNCFECYGPSPAAYKYIIDDNNFHIFKNIISRCPNIKHLHFDQTYIMNGQDLISIVNLCQKLESIKWPKLIYLTNSEFDEFTKIVGHKLIEWDCHYYFGFDRMKMLFEKFNEIEKVSISTMNQQESKQLFYYLNSNCQNLISLNCEYFHDDIEFDENMLNVIQRIEILKIPLNYFVRLSSFISLDNLTELNLKISETAFNFNINEIILNNLKKLILSYLNIDNMNVISKFKLPKLEYFDCSCCQFYICPTQSWDFSKYLPFYNQIKNIKTLKWDYLNEPTLLSSFDELINFECKFTCYYNEDFIEIIDLLSKHKSLQNIKLHFYLIYTRSFDNTNNIFDEIIKLSQTKRNPIFIDCHVFRKHLFKQEFIEFKKIADKTEQLYNIKFNYHY